MTKTPCETYVETTLLDAMNDRLGLMETTEFRHYTDQDREQMKAKIADVRLYFGA